MRLEGRIWQRAGKSVPVVCFHKTMEDVFDSCHKPALVAFRVQRALRHGRA